MEDTGIAFPAIDGQFDGRVFCNQFSAKSGWRIAGLHQHVIVRMLLPIPCEPDCWGFGDRDRAEAGADPGIELDHQISDRAHVTVGEPVRIEVGVIDEDVHPGPIARPVEAREAGTRPGQLHQR